jgi:hypothetical protein
VSRTVLRVVLGRPSPVDARRLLQEAAACARTLDAELAAMFVQDTNLLRWGSLPFAQEIGVTSGAVHRADPEALRRFLAGRVNQTRAILAQVAEGGGLDWSFTVTQGDLLREAYAVAPSGPVLLAPPRTFAQHASGWVWPAPARTTVAVLASPDTPAGDRAWSTAVRFAGGREEAVTGASLRDLVRGFTPRLLVVPIGVVDAEPGLLRNVLAAARCPVVLVG